MRYLLFLLMFVSIVCFAAVYMQNDPTGGVSYSDSASPHAVLVDVPEGGSISAPPPPQSNKKNAKNMGETTDAIGPMPYKPYTNFVIVSPADQETFQNQRDIPVEFSVEPALQRKDSIQLYVDGKPYRQPWQTPHTAIYQVDRGTHTVAADLLDEQGKMLKHSNTVTIFIHYAALGG